MKLPSLLRQLVPASAHGNMARDPKRAIAGINELLGSVKNLPRNLSNEGLEADTRLNDFALWAARRAPGKADFKEALKDIREITAEATRMGNEACRDQGKPGSRSSQDYYGILLTEKQGKALKHFARR